MRPEEWGTPGAQTADLNSRAAGTLLPRALLRHPELEARLLTTRRDGDGAELDLPGLPILLRELTLQLSPVQWPGKDLALPAGTDEQGDLPVGTLVVRCREPGGAMSHHPTGTPVLSGTARKPTGPGDPHRLHPLRHPRRCPEEADQDHGPPGWVGGAASGGEVDADASQRRPPLRTSRQPLPVPGQRRIEGSVRINGEPAVGVVIEFHRADDFSRNTHDRDRMQDSNRDGRMPTDDAGRFRFDHLAKGRYRLSVIREGTESWVGGVLWSQGIDLGENPVERHIDLVLGEIVLRVVGPNGSPVIGMNVSLSRIKPRGESGQEGGSLRFYGKTDLEGRLNIANAPEGIYRVTGSYWGSEQSLTLRQTDVTLIGTRFVKTLYAVRTIP